MSKKKAAAPIVDVDETLVVSTDEDVSRGQLRTNRLLDAKGEWEALKQWRKNGEQGERPSTPILDANAEVFSPIRGGSTKSRAGKGRRRFEPTPGHRFFRNGRPFGDFGNKLGTVAYQTTGGVVDGRERISTGELEALLIAAGIESPRTTAWSYTLPNGVLLEARIVDGEIVAKAPREPKAPKQRKSKDEPSAAFEVVGVILDAETLPDSPGAKKSKRSEPKAPPAKPISEQKLRRPVVTSVVTSSKSLQRDKVTPIPKTAKKKTAANARAARNAKRRSA